MPIGARRDDLTGVVRWRRSVAEFRLSNQGVHLPHRRWSPPQSAACRTASASVLNGPCHFRLSRRSSALASAIVAVAAVASVRRRPLSGAPASSRRPSRSSAEGYDRRQVASSTLMPFGVPSTPPATVVRARSGRRAGQQRPCPPSHRAPSRGALPVAETTSRSDRCWVKHGDHARRVRRAVRQRIAGSTIYRRDGVQPGHANRSRLVPVRRGRGRPVPARHRARRGRQALH